MPKTLSDIERREHLVRLETAARDTDAGLRRVTAELAAARALVKQLDAEYNRANRAHAKATAALIVHRDLYSIAREVTLEAGMPYTDPRTGVTTKPEVSRAKKA